jgi:hypothetical protein
MAGRPSKLNTERAKRITDLISQGLHRGQAGFLAGVDESTVSVWYHRGAREERGIYREFFMGVNAAEATFERAGVDALCATAPSNPRVMQWILSRRFPARWSRRDNVAEVPVEAHAEQQQAARALLIERLERLLPPEPEPAQLVEGTVPAAAAPDTEPKVDP